MRLNQLETVRLNGVNVVRDVVTVLGRNGSKQAVAGDPATHPSLRPISFRLPADADSWPRYERPALAGAGNSTAPRAGRLGSLAGDFTRRWQTIARTHAVPFQKTRRWLCGSMRDTLAGAMRRS